MNSPFRSSPKNDMKWRSSWVLSCSLEYASAMFRPTPPGEVEILHGLEAPAGWSLREAEATMSTLEAPRSTAVFKFFCSGFLSFVC